MCIHKITIFFPPVRHTGVRPFEIHPLRTLHADNNIIILFPLRINWSRRDICRRRRRSFVVEHDWSTAAYIIIIINIVLVTTSIRSIYKSVQTINAYIMRTRKDKQIGFITYTPCIVLGLKIGGERRIMVVWRILGHCKLRERKKEIEWDEQRSCSGLYARVICLFTNA